MNRRHSLACRYTFVGIVVTGAFVAGVAPDTDDQEDAGSPPTAQEIQSWVQVITGNNELPTRLLGAKQLLKVASPEGESAVVGILTSNQTDAVIAMTQALTDLNGMAPNSLIDPLVELLRSADEKVRDSAVNALASFRNEQVAVRVGRVAGNRHVEIASRLAAIEVLRRTAGEAQAVDAMIPLANDPDPRIRGPVFAIIELISQQQFNNNSEAVRAWWSANRDKPAGERWRRILQESDASLRRTRADLRSAHTRLVASLTELYDRSSDADRPARLQAYLSDPIAEVRSLGATLIKSMVADRKPVPEPVVASLSALIADPNVQVRRDALGAIRDLRRIDLAGRLMARWPDETNTDVRADLIGALGRLGNPEAIPFLIDRVTNETNNVLAAAAAESLGRLRSSDVSVEVTIASAAEPLLSLFERIPPVEVELRGRVLGAMAAIADARFLPTFLALLDDDEAALRLAAVRGVAAIGGLQQIGQLLSRMEDADASVRALAVEAVAQLGRDGTHLDALFARTVATAEPVENIRDAAWRGCLRILRGRPIETQIEWASRLDPTADLASARRLVELLTPLVAPPIAQQLDAERLAETEWKLGTALRRLQRVDDAVTQYQSALDRFRAANRPDARIVGDELVQTLLEANRTDEAAGVVRSLLASWPDADWSDLAEAMASHLQAKLDAGEAELVVQTSGRLIDEAPDPAGVAIRLRLEDIRTAGELLRNSQDTHVVRVALDEIQNAADENDTGVRKVLALGFRAERPLVQIIREAISSEGTNGTDGVEEKAIEMLKRVRPDWPGYAPDASPEEKNAALNAVQATGPLSASNSP